MTDRVIMTTDKITVKARSHIQRMMHIFQAKIKSGGSNQLITDLFIGT